MLNLFAFRLLADPKIVSDASARFLFRLLRTCDLRTYRAVSLRGLMDSFGYSYTQSIQHLEALSRVGLVELGPNVLTATGQGCKKTHSPTWRLGRPFLLSARDLAEWEAETRAEAERMSIAPPVEPSGPPAAPSATCQ